MYNESMPELVKWKVGYVSDPGPELKIDPSKLAWIKVKELDQRIQILQDRIEILKMGRDAIREQYKLK